MSAVGGVFSLGCSQHHTIHLCERLCFAGVQIVHLHLKDCKNYDDVQAGLRLVEGRREERDATWHSDTHWYHYSITKTVTVIS